MYGLVYYMPEYLQPTKGYSPVIPGVAHLPQTVIIVLYDIMVGLVVGFTGWYRWATWVGWAPDLPRCGLARFGRVQHHCCVVGFPGGSGQGTGLLVPSISLVI